MVIELSGLFEEVVFREASGLKLVGFPGAFGCCGMKVRLVFGFLIVLSTLFTVIYLGISKIFVLHLCMVLQIGCPNGEYGDN